MLEILKSIILDFHEITRETGVPRRMRIERVPGKATVVMGARRSGKTTYLFQEIERLVQGGVSVENILYINFFDDRLSRLEREGLNLIVEAYYSLFPEKKNREPVYCFFDEIQAVEGWEAFVDRIMRTEKCEVIITGSSSRMLSKEIATQMRGRALSWELFPFSFKEFLAFKGIDPEAGLTTRRRLLIQKAFDDYWLRGGFPETAALSDHLRVKIHQEYFHTILYRDIIERYDTAHPRSVLDLARRLMDNAATLYSINSLTGYLKSLGHKVPKSTVADYLAWFEDAYFLFTVRLFDASLVRSKTNPKKIYAIDHALVTSVASGILINSGHLLENLVFAALRRSTPHIYYGKTKSGQEIDFLLLMPDHSRRLIQVCESLRTLQTRKREVAALHEAMLQFGVDRSVIVTRGESEVIETDAGRIEVIPAWRFLLESPD